MKQTHSITVRGRQHTWNFDIEVDPKYLQEWRADGLEIDEVFNTIPMWVVNAGLMRPWVFVQDLFHFRNPFAK